jgi:hypothetical protein
MKSVINLISGFVVVRLVGHFVLLFMTSPCFVLAYCINIVP